MKIQLRHVVDFTPINTCNVYGSTSISTRNEFTNSNFIFAMNYHNGSFACFPHTYNFLDNSKIQVVEIAQKSILDLTKFEKK